MGESGNRQALRVQLQLIQQYPAAVDCRDLVTTLGQGQGVQAEACAKVDCDSARFPGRSERIELSDGTKRSRVQGGPPSSSTQDRDVLHNGLLLFP